MRKLSELRKPLNDWHCHEGRYYARATDAAQWRRWQEEKARAEAERIERWQQQQVAKEEREQDGAA